MNDLVSVIIPTYSRAEFITRAVDSVLAQTYPNVEIIVVDDNGIGTECQISTQRKLARYIELGKIQYVTHKKNMNGAAARNTGAKKCKGVYITFLDDDDVLYPQKIERQVTAIKSNPEMSAAYVGFRIVKGTEELKRVQSNLSGDLRFQLLSLQWGIGTGSNPLFKKEAFDSISGFDESFIRHQDLEFLIRFFRNNKIIAVPEILIDRNIDSRINSVDYEKFINVKNKFLETFKDDIESFSNEEQSIIYRNQFADVACHAIQAKAYKVAFYFYRKANSYKCLSLRILVKAFLYGFCGRKVE